MLHHFLEEAIPVVSSLLEIMGLLVILVAGLMSFAKYLSNLTRKTRYEIKISLGQSLSLALEFKMGAEILKTVLVHTYEEMFILGAIIVLRTILAMVIHWEIKSEQEHGSHHIETEKVA